MFGRVHLWSIWTWTFCLLDFFITILISLLVIGLLIFMLFSSSVVGVLAFFGICSLFLHCPVYWLIVVYRNILWLYFCGVCLFHFWFWHSAHALQQEKLPQWDSHALQLESKPCLLQPEKAPVQQQRAYALQQRLSAAKKKN